MSSLTNCSGARPAGKEGTSRGRKDQREVGRRMHEHRPAGHVQRVPRDVHDSAKDSNLSMTWGFLGGASQPERGLQGAHGPSEGVSETVPRRRK